LVSYTECGIKDKPFEDKCYIYKTCVFRNEIKPLSNMFHLCLKFFSLKVYNNNDSVIPMSKMSTLQKTSVRSTQEEKDTKKNLWILTEERPKPEVIEFIVKKYSEEKNVDCKITKIKFKSIIKKKKFCFEWEVKGIKINTIDKIIIKPVSGYSSFVDYLVFENLEEPKVSDKPLYLIEETKTTPSESRNVSVFQRTAKFVFIEQYEIFKESEKIMLYTLRKPYKSYPPTFIFGLKAMKTMQVSTHFLQDEEMIGKNVNTDGTLDEPKFENFEEFRKMKNDLSTERNDNTPIEIKIEESFPDEDVPKKISISAKLEKSGGFSYDPNIGAVSLLSFLSKKLSPKIEDIIIKRHGCENIKSKVENSEGKLVKIATALKQNFGVKLSLDGMELKKVGLKTDYWKIEKEGEKIGTIFLHLLLLDTKLEIIYEQHAGTERGYFVTPIYFSENKKDTPELWKTFQECVQKLNEKEYKKLRIELGLIDLPKDKSSEAIFGEDKSCETFHIPDLIILDYDNKEILIIEGEMAKNVNGNEKGVNQLPLFKDLEEKYIKKYYSEYECKKFVVLYGDEDEKYNEMKQDDKDKVIFRLKTDGTMITYDKCPQSIKDVIDKLKK